jgi:chromosome partitioning protein
MGSMRESCTVCSTSFDVQFRYQMEERDGGFSYYCSQGCLQASQRAGADSAVACDACATRFKVELVSHVLYVKGQRKYACSLDCRAQLTAEARGARLGDLAAQAEQPTPLHAVRQVSAAPLAAVAVPPAPPSGPMAGASGERRTLPSPSPVRVAAASAAAPSGTTPPATLGPSAPISSKPHSARSATPVSTTPAVKSVGRASASTPAPPPASEPRQIAQPAQGGAEAGLPRMIAVFNHKGGTGKTTTSVSLAAGLALRGKRVLLVDTDAQGNVSVSLGVKAERTLYHVLVMGLAGKDAVTNVRPNLDLIPSNETLAAAELYLAGRQNRDRVLAGRLASIVSQYDYVVVDCSPSLSLLNQNALCLVDSVLVPVACDYLSLVGMRQVIKTVKNVNQILHHPVRIWGVLPTFYDARANICHEAIDTLKQHFGPRCLRPVRQAIKVKEAPAQGQTIFEYAPGTAPAEDYQHLVSCVLGEVALSNGAPSAADIEPASAASALSKGKHHEERRLPRLCPPAPRPRRGAGSADRRLLLGAPRQQPRPQQVGQAPRAQAGPLQGHLHLAVQHRPRAARRDGREAQGPRAHQGQPQRAHPARARAGRPREGSPGNRLTPQGAARRRSARSPSEGQGARRRPASSRIRPCRGGAAPRPSAARR